MHIQNIKIKNFKLFNDNEFEFDEKFTLIIGDNGVGKTSLLEAIAIGAAGYLSGLVGVTTRNILKDDIRIGWDRVGDATVLKDLQFPVLINCEGIVHDEKISWTRTLESPRGRTTRTFAKSIIDIATSAQEEIIRHKNHNIILPLISFQSAGRLFSQKRNKWNDVFEKEKMSRFIGYTDCLETESNIKLFVNWLKHMTLIRIQKNKNIGELNAVIYAIETFMKTLVEEDEDVSIMYDFEEMEVMVELGANRLPLRMMSSGYRTIIGMIADLSYRAAILNPQLREDAAKLTPGIVLIDELDLHLHPKWQWKIINDLQTVFPNIQFIATTHSPILIASCKNGKIINLDKNERGVGVNIEQTPYGWQIEDVLVNIMEAPSRIPKVQEKIEKFKELHIKKMLNKLNPDENILLSSLEKELYSILPESDPSVTLTKLDSIMSSIKHD